MVAVDAGKPDKLLAAEGVEKYVQADTGAGDGNASDLISVRRRPVQEQT